MAEDLQITSGEIPDASKTISNAKIFQKNEKIVHKIYSKLLTFIKITSEDASLGHDLMDLTTIKIMRDLNKYKLYGYEKRIIAIGILQLLIQALSPDYIESYYTADRLEGIIENIYTHRIHTFKRPHKHRPSCILF